MEYFEAFPGMEGREGEEGVPRDLKSGVVGFSEETVEESNLSAMLATDWYLRSRRISSSISFWVRFVTSNFSALALFQREKRISVVGREGEGEGDFGENMDKREGGEAFNAAIRCQPKSSWSSSGKKKIYTLL